MKIHSRRHHRLAALQQGFTLIELLVVIAIIGVLVSMAMPAYNAVVLKARTTQARAVMTSLINGIKSYQAEYNHYPNVSSVTDGSDGQPIQTTKDNSLIICMLGTDNGQSGTNPRGIVYCNFPTAVNGSNGYDNTIGTLYDPWKQPYNVLMDLNGDGMIQNPYNSGEGASTGPSFGPQNLTTGVIIFSSGPDQKLGTNGGQSTDDIVSWQ